MELRIRPKSDFIHRATWEQLYVLTEHWKSDLEFYGDEIKFFKALINKYFMLLVSGKDVSEVQRLVKKITSFDKNQKTMIDDVTRHLSHIAKLLDNSFPDNEQKFKDEHANLENKWVGFVKDFKELKRTLFNVLEEILKSEKLGHLLAK